MFRFAFSNNPANIPQGGKEYSFSIKKKKQHYLIFVGSISRSDYVYRFADLLWFTSEVMKLQFQIVTNCESLIILSNLIAIKNEQKKRASHCCLALIFGTA